MLNIIKPVILIFAFNRPNHLKNLLDSLIKNKESNSLEIIFYIDGPRNSNDSLKISEVILVIEKYKIYFSKFKINKRIKNIGSKANIIDGITKSLKVYNSAIILEDDLIIDKYFLNFMIRGLKEYYMEKKVFHISGFSFLNSHKKNSSYLTRYMCCWGWATWSNRWAMLKTDPVKIEKEFTKKDIFEFNIENSHNFFRQIIENRIGILNTWAILWYATIFKMNGLCLVPSNSLVLNQGYDGSGERLGKDLDQTQLNNLTIDIFPKTIKEDKRKLKDLKKYFLYRENFFKSSIKNFIYLIPPRYQKPIMNKLIKIRYKFSNSK